MHLFQLLSSILLLATLAAAAPAPMAETPSNETDPSTVHTMGHGCGWSFYDRTWHSVPEQFGENLDAGDCHTPPTPFRDYKIFEKCMCYFYSQPNCKGKPIDNHPQKWEFMEGPLNPRGASYWCDWPQQPGKVSRDYIVHECLEGCSGHVVHAIQAPSPRSTPEAKGWCHVD
ncbi:hypothetical protein K458DRAFT_429149 [Lentithecium fluviatile CBS 122367]|uniref:Uncharacterized protein n=1 Tax=Lentithecium fluviatile CBS 122367 TaxID=1168545 RepID=A0A6G1J9J5_9PLEO|nr:hypothetical protein K458DRAFT_429149 [Lentithecium fluviatile CBS 122367]